ncbi:MAG: hypothetical protein AAGC72_01325 [Planctomycetota bacterium]
MMKPVSRHASHTMLCMGVFIALFGLVGCQSTATSDRQQGQADDENPMRWATYSRQPMAVRAAGVERVLAEDAEGFWQDAAALARQIDDWPMIGLLADKASLSADERALPWLVRSWAMASKLVHDDERPESKAIALITDAPADQFLIDVVFESPDRYEPATQVAAWAVMVRMGPGQWLRDSVTETPDAEAGVLVSMLKHIAPAVDVLPVDREAVTQMMRLSAALNPEQWQHIARYRVTQQGDGPWTLALRHVPALERRNKARDTWAHARWITHVASRLSERRHVSRGERAQDDLVITARPEHFMDHRDELGVADLIVLDHLLDAMQDRGIKRALFEHAEADRLDNTTEYGGALTWDQRGSLHYKPFIPVLRMHDQAYIASTRCMQAVHVGLAHVHFHAQRYENSPWAGPGKGDLDFVEAQHVNAVVLTFVDTDTLNIDAYFPGGIVIDLGCITR